MENSLLNALGTGLGYLGDVGEKFGLRAVKGALTGHPRELLSPIPFSDTLGLTDPGQRTTGAELATKLGIAREGDPLGQAAMGLGVDIALDPLTYAGGFGAARHLAKAPEVARAASKWSKLKALREPTTLVKNLGSFGGGERIIGNRLERALRPGIDPLLANMAIDIHNVAPAQGRMISPWATGELEKYRNFGFSRGGVPTERQELHHALLKNAALSGQYGGLNLPGQTVARTLGAGLRRESPLLMGLGEAGLETVGHGAEQRGLLPQLKEMARFTYSPTEHGLYHPQIAAHSPAAAALWHAAPGAVPGALAGAAGGAGAGYEEGGVPGALGGAALGGLGGAALGGLGSHLAYAPREAGLLKVLKAGGLGEESAARLLAEYDPTMRAMDVPGTPLNRLQRLAEAAGVGYRIPRTDEQLLRAMGAVPGGGPFYQEPRLHSAIATYDPGVRKITPNIYGPIGNAWRDTHLMNELMKLNRTVAPGAVGPQLATNLADHPIMHEISHALQHRQIAPRSLNLFNTLDKLYEPVFAPTRPHIPHIVSEYAATNPTEYIAERNVQRIQAHLANMTADRPTIRAADPAEKLYRMLQGPQNPTRLLDEFDRMYGGDLGRALRGESQSLGLKYDQPIAGKPGPEIIENYLRKRAQGGRLPPIGTAEATQKLMANMPAAVPIRAEDVGLLRADPEWINNRTFYHGTATPGLTGAQLDPTKTALHNLYGQGIYTTEEAAHAETPVTGGYAKARMKEAEAKIGEQKYSHENFLNALASGRLKREDIGDVLRQLGYDEGFIERSTGPNVDPKIVAARAKGPIQTEVESIRDWGGNPGAPDEYNALLKKIDAAITPELTARPTIYQIQNAFQRILDLERPEANVYRAYGRHYPELEDLRLERGWSPQKTPIGKVIEKLAKEMGGLPPEGHTALLRKLEYDAMTHGGGGRTYGSPHQVVIGIDPNNVLGIGQASPYKQWQPYKSLLPERDWGF